MVPPPFPLGPPCPHPHIARVTAAAYDLLADQLTLVVHEAALDEPLRDDGRPSDPFTRGLAEGAGWAITAMRHAASHARERAVSA